MHAEFFKFADHSKKGQKRPLSDVSAVFFPAGVKQNLCLFQNAGGGGTIGEVEIDPQCFNSGQESGPGLCSDGSAAGAES